MSTNHFLAGLPALLGVAAFFAYLWAGQSREGARMLGRIVDKLRNDPNIDVKQYDDLTPTKLKSLIDNDVTVRKAVNEGDLDLLRLLIKSQYRQTALVIVVCAALIGVS